MRTQSFDASRFVAVRLDPGEDVLLSLRAAVKEQGIRDAAILSGVGSLDRYHFHVVQTTNMPPGNSFVQGEGPFDILTVTGLVVDGQVHAHITFSNKELAMGGHLEEGCRVLTFAVVLIAEALNVDITGWDRSGPLASCA
jgi:predicted DNA-binding protein with PD1-like motif